MPVGRSRRGLAAIIALGAGCSNEFTPSAPPAIEVLTREVLSDTMAVGDSIDVEIRLTDTRQARDFLLRVEWNSSADTILFVVPGAATRDSARSSLADTLGARLHARLHALRHGTATVTVRVNQAPFDSAVFARTILVRERWVSVAAGFAHTCALNSVGVVYCWGQGNGIAHPYGGSYDRPTRLMALGSTSFDRIEAGWERTCASNSVTTAFACWGSNFSGELGAGPYVGVVRSPQLLAGMRELGMRRGVTCGIIDESYFRISCWGWAQNGAFWRTDEGIESCKLLPFDACGYLVGANEFLEKWPDERSLALGDQHACVLVGAAGRVICWGRNDYDQVMPAADAASEFVMDSSRTGMARLSAGAWHTCGLTVAQQVQCWGLNISHQSGDEDGTTCLTEGAVSLVSVSCSDGGFVRDDAGAILRAVDISAGDSHSCAITLANSAVCWGSNSAGQLGSSSGLTSCPTITGDENFPPEYRAVPRPCRARAVAVDSNLRFASVSAGVQHSCAITLDRGAIYCWGYNSGGRLGIGQTTHIVAPPTRVIEP